MKVLHQGIDDTRGAVYVGRPTKWGNPFVIGKDGDRDRVILKYEKWLLTNQELMSSLHELTGRDLVCWCSPLACHADILMYYANSPGILKRMEDLPNDSSV